MIFNLSNPYEVEKYKEYVNKLFKDKAIVEIKKKLPNRSLSQNSYLHLLLSFFACELGYSLDEVKLNYFKKTCNRDLFERKKINKQGKEITYMRSSSELTTGEMTKAIERFRNWSVVQADLYLPSPNEQQFLFHIEQEIQRHKEFI